VLADAVRGLAVPKVVIGHHSVDYPWVVEHASLVVDAFVYGDAPVAGVPATPAPTDTTSTPTDTTSSDTAAPPEGASAAGVNP